MGQSISLATRFPRVQAKLRDAVVQGDVAAVDEVLRAHPKMLGQLLWVQEPQHPLDQVDTLGKTPLMLAVASNRFALAAHLLRTGAAVNRDAIPAGPFAEAGEGPEEAAPE